MFDSRELARGILELFAEAGRWGQAERKIRNIRYAADLKRDRKRSSVLDLEMGLRAVTRRGVALRRCPRCRHWTEQRVGTAGLQHVGVPFGRCPALPARAVPGSSREQARALVAGGKTPHAVARLLGRSQATVRAWTGRRWISQPERLPRRCTSARKPARLVV